MHEQVKFSTAHPLDISANCYRVLFKLYDCVYTTNTPLSCVQILCSQ